MDERTSRLTALSFLTGALTAVVVLALFASALVWRVGVASSAERLRDLALLSFAPTRAVLRMPPDVRTDLEALHAVVENAGNPADADPHDTILTQPDERFGWTLRPDARVRGYQLRARNPLNFDPPVVYVPADAKLPPRVERHLAEEARAQFLYTVDADGRRLTLPVVDSPQHLVVVGDSVAFGVGVADGETAASLLQRDLGDSVRVLNEGVGSYDGGQALDRARALAGAGGNRALIYLTSENDFRRTLSGKTRKGWADNARGILEGFAALADQFPGGIFVVSVSYAEHTLRELLQYHGWDASRLAESERLYRELPAISASLGLRYVDFPRLVADYVRQSGTTFSPFALYVDHCHLSPAGNRLVAESLLTALSAGESLPRAAAPRR